VNIKIGTRGSKLALWQAYHIQELLHNSGCTSEIIIIETKGDLILDKALSKIGSKGVFTEELETALRSGKIDIAVHSAKDVQSKLDDDIPLIAFTNREITNDVVVSYDPNINLNDNITIGTSSTRRVALLKHYFPHVNIVDMRGNLQTRFQKMKDGHCDAMILAYAGVHRMELDKYIAQKLSIQQFVPPVGQGCVAIQANITSMDQNKLDRIIKTINDKNTELCVRSERAFLRQLEGGCSIPVFGNAVLNNNLISLTGGLISLDGNTIIKKTIEGENPDEIGELLAQEILYTNGKSILDTIKNTLKN
jgi:hydroxymethylbilane synthase